MDALPEGHALAHWRTWLDLASAVFAAWLLAALLDVSVPPFLRPVLSLGLPLAIGLFFVGLAALVRRQRTDGD